MKKLKFICFFLILIIVSEFPGLNRVSADGWYASYGNISWKEEQALLGNFAIDLNNNLEMIGYIGFYVGKKDTLRKVTARINRAKSFLIDKFKVEKSRIVIVNIGKSEKTNIILQPVSKELSPPF